MLDAPAGVLTVGGRSQQSDMDRPDRHPQKTRTHIHRHRKSTYLILPVCLFIHSQVTATTKKHENTRIFAAGRRELKGWF